MQRMDVSRYDGKIEVQSRAAEMGTRGREHLARMFPPVI